MDACRKKGLEHPSEPVMELGSRGEHKFLFLGEIMACELICHLELLKIVLLVEWKLSSGAPLLREKLT